METQIVSFQNESTTPQTRLVKRAEFQRRAGVSNSKFYDLIAKGIIPPAIHPHGTRTAVWPESDVDEYVNSVIKAARG